MADGGRRRQTLLAPRHGAGHGLARPERGHEVGLHQLVDERRRRGHQQRGLGETGGVDQHVGGRLDSGSG